MKDVFLELIIRYATSYKLAGAGEVRTKQRNLGNNLPDKDFTQGSSVRIYREDVFKIISDGNGQFGEILDLNKLDMLTVKSINNFIFKTLDEYFNKETFFSYQGREIGCYKRKSNKRLNDIGYGLTSLIDGSYRINGFLAFIAYPELEKIVHPILKKNELKGGKTNEVKSSFGVENNFKNILPDDFIVKDEKDLIFVAEKFRLFLTEDALPYFNKWHNLTVLNEYIKQDSSREFQTDLLGHFHQFRKATILRLCNEPSYEMFMDSFYKNREEIFKKYPNEIVAERYYNAAKELKEVLEITKPIYNLEA